MLLCSVAWFQVLHGSEEKRAGFHEDEGEPLQICSGAMGLELGGAVSSRSLGRWGYPHDFPLCDVSTPFLRSHAHALGFGSGSPERH